MRGISVTMRKTWVIIECIILFLGVLLSIQGTVKVVAYSVSYIPYFIFAVIGIVFIVVLFLLRKKKLTFLLGIGMIFCYLITAGFGYIVCVQNAARMKRLEFFEGKEVVINVGEEEYIWNGEAVYQSENLVPVDVTSDNASVTVSGEKKSISFVYVIPGDDDTIYYEIYSGSTGDYLVMEKQAE